MRQGLRKLEKLIDVRASYSLYHLVKALFLMEEKPQGRGHLMEVLGLGEASVKTLMKQLQQAKMAKKTTKGLALAEEGWRLVGGFGFSRPVEVDAGDLTLGEKDCAILVKNAAGKIRSGLEQRDAAMKAGAEGATVLVFKEGKPVMPGVEQEIEALGKELRKRFEIEDGDAVVIGTAKSPLKAEEGAYAAVFSIDI